KSFEKVIVIDLDNETELEGVKRNVFIQEFGEISTEDEGVVTVYNREDAPNYKAFIKGASFKGELKQNIRYSNGKLDGIGSSEKVRSSDRAEGQGESGRTQADGRANSSAGSGRQEIRRLYTEDFRKLQESSLQLSDAEIQAFHDGSKELDEEHRSSIRDVFKRWLDSLRGRDGFDDRIDIEKKTPYGVDFDLLVVDGEVFHVLLMKRLLRLLFLLDRIEFIGTTKEMDNTTKKITKKNNGAKYRLNQ
ncbi:MAG: hypothetical protein J6Y68_02960, partial [Clostridia bacterium]|nr:hypothetical protein [Clostridia bacterium]